MYTHKLHLVLLGRPSFSSIDLLLVCVAAWVHRPEMSEEYCLTCKLFVYKSGESHEDVPAYLL